MSLFKSRKPKRIISSDPSTPTANDEDHSSGPVVRRPGAAKKASKLRVAFNPEGEDESSLQTSENEPAVARPNKVKASTALQDKLRETTLRDRETDQASGPSYSKSYLDELRNSTPSTPSALTTTTPPSDHQIDLASKFPTSSLTSNRTYVPSSTEISAFKARRSRALAESKASEDYITLSGDAADLLQYDSDGEFKPQRMQLSTFLQPEKDIRLVREDEDVLEGFDSFVEDLNPGGRIQMDLSRRALHQRRKTDREAMRTQIEAAEDTDSEASGYDSDDDARHVAYEQSQFHAGLDGLKGHAEHTRRSQRPRQPKVVMPIEKLSVGLGRLREQVARIELERGKLERRKGEIKNERQDLNRQREHVQKSLEEASRELERVNGAAGPTGERSNGGASERGLESMGIEVDGDDSPRSPQ